MPVCARSEDVAPIPIAKQLSTIKFPPAVPEGPGNPAPSPAILEFGRSQRGASLGRGVPWWVTARGRPGDRAFEEDSVKGRYVAAIAVIAALVIAGCSSSGGGSKQQASGGGSKTLTVWMMDGSAPKQLVADVDAEFQSSHQVVPVYSANRFVVHRTDLFKPAGISQAPTSIDQWIADGQTLAAANKSNSKFT